MRRLLAISKRTISNKITRLSELTYPTAKMYHQYRLYRKERQFNHSPIFIYQMGKVASKSITNSLMNVINNRNIYHVHITNPESIQRQLSFRMKKKPPYKQEEFNVLWRAEYIRKLLASKSPKNRYKIITLVREPVSHDISTFFQNFTAEKSNSEKKCKLKSDWFGFEMLFDESDLDSLVNLFLEKKDHYWTLRYFDLEFRDQFEIDFYKKDFPKSKGYQIYQHENYHILLIKYENLKNCLSKAFKEFLGIENFQLQMVNTTKEKEHGQIYELFKKKLILPNILIDEVYSSKYARHFYSEVEIESFKKKWTNEL